MRSVDVELEQAVIDAQVAAQRAHNLAYKRDTPLMMKLALGRAQSILMTWQVRIARANWRARRELQEKLSGSR